MAESVDALVSNTSGATHPGSSPGLGTKLESTQMMRRSSLSCGALFFPVFRFNYLVFSSSRLTD